MCMVTHDQGNAHDTGIENRSEQHKTTRTGTFQMNKKVSFGMMQPKQIVIVFHTHFVHLRTRHMNQVGLELFNHLSSFHVW